MQKILNHFVVLICKFIARLPFWAIYGLSDIFYVLIFHVIKYRRNVVFRNLTKSFPEKTQEEIRAISKKFYKHLADLGLEALKYSHMTEKEIDDRLKIHGLEIFEEYYNQNRSLIVIGMHYANWEWCLSMQRLLKARFKVVYNPMRNNPEFEEFLTESRERFGAKSIPVNHSARVAMSFNNASEPSGIFLAADQTPPWYAQFWTSFLNQETAFFPGPMKIAAKTNQPVIVQHTKKVGRGRYEVYHYKLIENPAEVEPGEILSAYVNKLEEIIKAEPEYWLWSHRRWKHKRPEGVPLHKR